jgi:glycosyltransferase involved in cell wall biosynthesis
MINYLILHGMALRYLKGDVIDLRVGILINDPIPEFGGAYTFIDTIIQDIVSSDCEYEFYVFFYDPNAPQRYSRNKINFINCYQPPPPKPNLLIRFKRKIFRMRFNQQIIKKEEDIFLNENIDLLWILGPYNANTIIPFVFTVWDLGHRIYPFFPEYKADEWKIREEVYNKMIKRATYIITGNRIGKNEIIENYSITHDKIHIIPFPIPKFCLVKEKANYSSSFQIKLPFVFFPAQFWAHKNHIILIEAIAWLRDVKNIIINCYFTGHDYGNMDYVNNMIIKYKLNNQIFILGFISQDDLIYLYKNALAMVFTSYLGPTNLPLLEAIAFECPLIYSNIPGHIEQMEGVGIPFDNTNCISLGENILKIYNDSEFRKEIISKERIFFEKHKSYSYFDKMKELIDEFFIFYKTWKE